MTVVDPTLGRVPRVLVPVQVDALVLAEPTGGFADCRMSDPDPAGGRQDLLPPPFADRAASRPAGVHLHWALPDALTHTRPTVEPAADGTAPVADMPAIPDRWLVVRLSRGATPDRRALRAWVIEASGTVPTVRPLATWQESGVLPLPGREPTAFGPGDLAWSAYYDNVVGRLGFHDPVDDGADGPLAYLVTGWYADPRLDPLADPTITSLSAFYQRMAELGWSLPGGELEQDVLAVPFDVTAPPGSPDAAALATLAAIAGPGPQPTRGPLITDGSWWPQGLMAHGSVVGLGWPGPGWPDAEAGLLDTDPGGPPDPADTRVAFGATPSEALGALMVGFLAAAQGVSEDEIVSEDRLLEAFQIGLLSEIDHPDGRARLDARLHADGFRALAADQRTVAAPLGQDDPDALGGSDSDAAEPVARSQPRWFGPGEPAVVVQGLRRSLKHGGDGRFSPDGSLVCRLSGFTVTSLSAQLGDGNQRATVQAGALLETGFAPPNLPPDCVDLVRETVLLDPGSARAAALTTLPPLAGPDTRTVDELTRNFLVEQTVWWALRDPLVDGTALLSRSGIAGSLPSPLAVTPPTAVWAPRHLDWEVEVFPTPGGLAGWRLGDIDHVPGVGPGPSDDVFDDDAPGAGVVVRGRSLLTGGVAQRAARAGQAAIELVAVAGSAVLGGDPSHIFVPAAPDAGGGTGGISSGTQTIAQAFVSALRNMDVMAATLDGVHARLRGEPTGQWVGSSAPPPLDPAPAAPGLIAGSLRPTRLRLVDTFGQIVDLLDSGPDRPAAADQALTSRPTTVDGHPGLVALAPRFAAPSRLLFRFVDAGGTSAGLAGLPETPLEDIDESVRPVAGYLLPDHLDGALEVFDAAGTALGQLLPALDGTGRAVWEQAPGRPTGAGDLPSDVIADPALGAVTDGLVRWGDHDGATSEDENEGALGALLRLIDSTLWATDPFGHTGDEHAALLTGHPIVVLRAVLRLEVDDPLDPDELQTTPVPVRLGALAQWQDGLLGFFVGDDPTHVRSTGPAAAGLARPVGPGQGYLGPAAQVGDFHRSFAADLAPRAEPATPVTHPYVVDDPVVWVWPGVDVPVTLLVVPHATVHATSGLLPRKDLGMRRQWVADGLSRLAPAFRFGPVLVDPRSIRMPVAADLTGSWTWNHRRDVATWTDDAVVNATADALMTAKVAVAEEGWLTLHPLPTEAPS
jgi:hypothetical protein